MQQQVGRNYAIDTFKGILTFFMVYCHVLQFFGDSQLFPQNEYFMLIPNLLVFPAFVFSFGQNVQHSYYTKPLRQAAPRMTSRALRLYAVFAFSGIGFRVLRENRPFAAGVTRRVLLLEDIPGWSEFIIAFSLFFLLALLLWYPMRRWKGPLLPAALGLVSLLSAFIPYGMVGDTRLQLLIGGRGFACFPVLQYAAFFLFGMAAVRARGQKKAQGMLLLFCALLSGLGLWRRLSLGGMPERFPPDIGWLLLPFLPIALLYLLCEGLEKLRYSLSKPILGRGELRLPLAPLRALGRNSMSYLLLSNLLIFTMAGRGILPKLKPGSPLLFGHPIQAAGGAFWWTLTLLCAIAVILSLVSKPSRIKKENPT